MAFFTHSTDPRLIVKKLLNRLLMEDSTSDFDRQEMWYLFRAVFIARDPVLLAAFRNALREKLKSLGESLSDSFDEKKSHIIAYILCLLPHTEPKPSPIEPPYEIPLWSDDKKKWEMVAYTVRPIELTSTWGPEAFVMVGHERVFAYGLDPVSTSDGGVVGHHSILLLKGIPVPTGQGFATQWFAEGFSTPGSWLLYTGYVSLERWLSKKSVDVYGAGQGGSKACGLITNPAVKSVYAYNPSNLGALATSQLQNQWLDLSQKPKVQIYHQHDGGIYSYLQNKFPEWKISHIMMPKNDNHWLGIMPCYAAHSLSVITETKQEEMTSELHRRWVLYLMANQILRHLVFGLFALPCRFVVLPTVRALLQHKTEALIISLLVFAGMMFPGMLGAPLGITAVVAASLYLGYKLLNPLLQRFVGVAHAPEAACHRVEPGVNLFHR